MDVDGALITVVGQCTGFALIGKWLIKSAERSNTALPSILQAVDNLKDTTRELKESVSTLFSHNNANALDIREIKTSINHCEACNAHLHRRSTDPKP